jgi:CheY-like chemotaxis protein
VKFTPVGGRIRLEVEDDGEQLRLRCIDDGIGFEPAVQATIFAAFEQASDEVRREYGGLGLGLAIAQGLVAQHGGGREARSAGPGRGATFTLRLATIAAPVSAPASALPGTSARDGARRLRMLLVEDNEDAAMAMSMSLEYMGYEVTHAPTLREALAVGTQQRFDVIVTDLGLPDGSGLELGPVLAARAPLIALSGFGSAEDVARSMSAGFVAHLVKPTDPDDVHATVGKVLMGLAAAA